MWDSYISGTPCTLIVGCTCDKTGAKDGNQCAHKPTGECRCKPTVTGVNCDECLNGYWNFGIDDYIGCEGGYLCLVLGLIKEAPSSRNSALIMQIFSIL